MTHKFSHIGICTADIDRSMRFYSEGLDFKIAESFDVGNEVGRTMEVDGVKLRSQFLRRDDGISIELLYFHEPDCFGPRERRAMNQYGLTHLSFWVEDMDAALEKIRKAGGTVHDKTFNDLGYIKLVFCTDPDGVRVELMQAGAS
jgi:predicted enzyme related to lactoylglutathione lyase